jgi:hypothetical protein
MNRDVKLLKWLVAFLLIPLAFAIFGGDKFRYPCQNPENWDKEICKLPTCDVTRTCPQHIFKGQRDPRLGPPTDDKQNTNVATPAICPVPTKGENCAK